MTTTSAPSTASPGRSETTGSSSSPRVSKRGQCRAPLRQLPRRRARLDVVRPHRLVASHLLELVLGPGLRLDAHGLAFVAGELLDVNRFVVFCFAGVDEDFVLLGHGDLPWCDRNRVKR